MKRKLFLFAAAGLFALSAVGCAKNADNPDGPSLPKFKTFAVLKADNTALTTDYVAENPSGNIDFALPVETLAGVLDTIVITFEPSVENITVHLDSLEGKVVESKDTINFSNGPVDFYLTDGQHASLCTVKIAVKDAADGWKQIASTSEDQTFYSDPVFVGNNGKLYIAGIRNADQTAGRYPYALVADGKGGFETVTRDTCFIHKRADNVNIAFAPDNTMYAAFADYSKSSTPSTSVMKVTASEATYVGDTCALYRTNGTNPIVVFANTDAVYTANGVNSASGGIAKRCMNLTKYSAGSWTQAIAISGRPSDAYAYVSFSKATNGKKLDLVYNQNKGSYSCYDFAGKDPATVFEGIVVRNSDNTENLTSTQLPTSISSMGIDVDGDGNVYVLLYAKWDLANNSLGVVRLSYDSGSQVWNQSIIGGVIPNVSAKYGQASIAFDSDNVLHIAHTDENGKVVIRHIDKTTKLWSAPTVVGGKDYRSKAENPTFPDVKMINVGGKLYIMAMSQDTHMVDIYTTE